jgi:hypothetical protein
MLYGILSLYLLFQNYQAMNDDKFKDHQMVRLVAVVTTIGLIILAIILFS